MSSYSRLKAAVAHWGPRFVANGVVLTDFEEVTSSIASDDEWCGAWSKRAAHHEQLGREALAKKTADRLRMPAARRRILSLASFLFVHDQAQMKAAHKKADRVPAGSHFPISGHPANVPKSPIRAKRSPASCASPQA